MTETEQLQDIAVSAIADLLSNVVKTKLAPAMAQELAKRIPDAIRESLESISVEILGEQQDPPSVVLRIKYLKKTETKP